MLLTHPAGDHIGEVVPEQPLEAADAIAAQRQPVEALMLRHMLEQPHKVGRRMLDRVRVQRQMLVFQEQRGVHLAHALLQQRVLVFVVLVERRAVDHRPLADVQDADLLEGPLSHLRH